MFESKSGVLLIAGLGFFFLAFLASGLVPWLVYAHIPEKTAEEVVNRNLLVQFRDLRDRYLEPFKRHFGELTPDTEREKCAEALRLGRKIYTGEGCWHCHSQFVRPVSNEDIRWGPVAKSEGYANELQRPVMFGTRRVGPDLSREAGRHGNDWHVVHFYRPRMAVPESVMPDYPWFFDKNAAGGPGEPNKRGFAIITYMQWLGSWSPTYPTYKERDRSADYGEVR
jgi:cytochrome c oxidase cbb3-type subunit II